MRRRARVDANQKEIVAKLRKFGCSILHTHQLGKGAPDIIIGYNNLNYLIEIKDGSKTKSQQKLTPDELNFNLIGKVHTLCVILMSKLYLLLMRVIDLLAQKNDDWIRMAKSFKITDDQANEIVQEMYLRINDYVKDVNKIMYDDKQINTFYVYITLRNIYYSNFYNTGKNIKNRKVIYFSDIVDKDDSSKLAKYMIEDPEEAENIIDKKIKLDNLIDKIEDEINSWYWYDKKMTKLYMNTKMSMRDISKETKISLSSIFNTLTNAKEKIRKVADKEYKNYKK